MNICVDKSDSFSSLLFINWSGFLFGLKTWVNTSDCLWVVWLFSLGLNACVGILNVLNGELLLAFLSASKNDESSNLNEWSEISADSEIPVKLLGLFSDLSISVWIDSEIEKKNE